MLFGIVAAVLLGIFVLPEADITVHALSTNYSNDIPITLSGSATQPDSQKLVLPTTLIDTDKTFSQDFSATGQANAGTQARGTVQIYNFTGKILKFKASTTTFTASNGQQYVLTTDISGITPTKYLSGTSNPDPASLTAPVAIIAKLGGDDGNLPAGTRLEMHTVLGDLPATLYAATPDGLDGGSSRQQTQVSDQDLQNAKTTLTANLLQSVQQDLAAKNLTTLAAVSQIQTTSITFDKNAGDAVAAFHGSITAHIKALAYNPSDLQQLLEDRVKLTMPTQNQTDDLQFSGESMSNITANQVDYQNLAANMLIHFQATVAPLLDAASLKPQLIGKDAIEIKEILLDNPNVQSLEVGFKPFWVTTVPKYSKKVNISVVYDTVSQ